MRSTFSRYLRRVVTSLLIMLLTPSRALSTVLPYGCCSVQSRGYISLGKSSSTQLTKVTVAGTSGAIGPSIISALSRAGFEVQALSRRANASPRLHANARRVDYTNLQELRSVLEGQDAVVSCLGDTPAAVSAQRALIEASIDVGVQRFLPSEFGSDTSNPYVSSLPFFESKVNPQEILKAAASRHRDFTYTFLITGLFLDWCLGVVPCILDCGSSTAQVYDDGNIPFSVTRTAVVAAAVTSILSRPDQTRNKIFRVHETSTTQNELIQRAQHLADLPFACTMVDTAAYEAHAWRAYASHGTNALDWIVPFINLSIWSKSQPGHFRSVDNELLGVCELRDAQRTCMIDAELQKATETFRRSMQHGVLLDPSREAYNEGKQKLVAY